MIWPSLWPRKQKHSEHPRNWHPAAVRDRGLLAPQLSARQPDQNALKIDSNEVESSRLIATATIAALSITTHLGKFQFQIFTATGWNIDRAFVKPVKHGASFEFGFHVGDLLFDFLKVFFRLFVFGIC